MTASDPSVLDLDLPSSLAATRQGEIALLRLARPDKRNALDDVTVQGLHRFFRALPAGIKAVVLYGEGPHFSAGLDLTEVVEQDDILRGVAHSQMWHRAFHEIQFGRVPVVAGLQGAVVGGGLELAAAIHVREFPPAPCGIYADVSIEVPAHLVQRICGTGIEAIIQGADLVGTGKIDLALCVGAESMSRNPVAAYTHCTGFRLGQVEFKDFLWESLLDTSCGTTMGGTAENLAVKYQITRPEVDAYSARSFNRAFAAQQNGFLPGEIVPVRSEVFARDGFEPRAIRLPAQTPEVSADSHVRASPVEVLAKIRPVFGGMQTGGNSSAVVDGAAATLVASRVYAERRGKAPLARLLAGVSVGCPPDIMGIGPVPAIRVLEAADLPLGAIDRFEINEAFGAQVMACARELGLDEEKLNVNGGAIAIGHPLDATGVRLSVTLARALARSGGRYGVASACISGGQGIAQLVENPQAA